MIVAPWMWGLGILGVAGAGIAVYEVTKGSSAPAATGVKAPIIPGAAPPIVSVQRPAVAAAGQFGQSQAPTGPQVTIAPGTMPSVSLPQGQLLILILPVGASWTIVRYNNGAGQIAAQANLNNDWTSPIGFTSAQLAVGTGIIATWKTAAGAVQATIIPYVVI